MILFFTHISLLAIRFFTAQDIFLIPALLFISYYLVSKLASTKDNAPFKKIILRAFVFKLIGVSLFVLISEFYFKGGDSNLYFQAVKDMRAATADDLSNLSLILKSDNLNVNAPYFNYFYYDGFDQDLTWNYMLTKANYAVPRIALIPSFILGESFFSLCLAFGLFAFWGSVKLFKVFIYYYPSLVREIGFATLFLPSVVFWSSGLLKDPITFGCIGFFLSALLDLLIRRKSYVRSVFVLALTSYVIFLIKGYIILTLILAISVWVFSEISGKVKDKVLRNILNYFMIMISVVFAFQGVNSLTSLENAQEYKVESIFSNAEVQRGHYETISTQLQKKDSYFTINTSNPITTALSGLFATFFRPFIWEINTPIAILAFIESTILLLLTLHFIRKGGAIRLISIPFRDPRILFCFTFAVIFAIAVGISSTNFGALSRYKIPMHELFHGLSHPDHEIYIPSASEMVYPYH